MKKKMLILFISCFISILNISNIESQESAYVYVIVKDSRYYNPITWAYVSVENTMCNSIGFGYYRGVTCPGSHPVFVSGRVEWVYLQPGYNWIYVYL